MKPKLLDLFCGAGGAGMGYHRAGFDVVGIDIKPQPNYPFEFIRANANTYPLDGFDAYHASPPCQAHSIASKMGGSAHKHPCYISNIRQRLTETGKPFAIENVESAPLVNTTKLCGTRFQGLRVIRHRLFETNFWVRSLRCTSHPPIFVYGSGPLQPEEYVTVAGGSMTDLRVARKAMGVEWMQTLKEVVESIPPAYTEYIGYYMMAALLGERRVDYPDHVENL